MFCKDASVFDYRICYTELNLLLIAIESGIKTTKEKLRLNPQSATIGFGTTGFFIAQSPEEVRRYITTSFIWRKFPKEESYRGYCILYSWLHALHACILATGIYVWNYVSIISFQSYKEGIY